MTGAERFQFLQAFNRLSVSLPMPQELRGDDEMMAGQRQAYFETLADLPLEAVVEAASRLQKKGSGYFPSTQEWYRAADDIAYSSLVDRQAKALPPAQGSSMAHKKAKEARAVFLETLRQTPARNGWDFAKIADQFERAVLCRDPTTNPYAPWCADCQDSGWCKRVCRDGDRCAQHVHEDREWGEHDHAARCSCVGMNPKIQQRQALRR